MRILIAREFNKAALRIRTMLKEQQVLAPKARLYEPDPIFSHATRFISFCCLKM